MAHSKNEPAGVSPVEKRGDEGVCCPAKDPAVLKKSLMSFKGVCCSEKESAALQRSLLPCKEAFCPATDPAVLKRSILPCKGSCCPARILLPEIVICTLRNLSPEQDCLCLNLPGGEGLCGFDSAFGSFMKSFYQKERKKQSTSDKVLKGCCKLHISLVL
jgi:hypothetical protein